jgi:hypothetical protein
MEMKAICMFLLFASFISCTNEAPQKPAQIAPSPYKPTTAPLPTFDLFRNVSLLQKRLSSNGIGTMRAWRGDEVGWLSSTDYFSFGSPSIENGLQNNLAYYIDSEAIDFAQRVKLVLNVNNASEMQDAIGLFHQMAFKTFKSLEISPPQGVSESILGGQNFKVGLDNVEIEILSRKFKILEMQLIITSK